MKFNSEIRLKSLRLFGMSAHFMMRTPEARPAPPATLSALCLTHAEGPLRPRPSRVESKRGSYSPRAEPSGARGGATE